MTIGTIGGGSFAVEKAFGATDEQAAHSAIVNSLFHLTNVAGKKAYDKVYKVWENGKSNDVYVDSQGNVKLLKGEVRKDYVDAEIVDPKSAEYVRSENAKNVSPDKKLGEGRKLLEAAPENNAPEKSEVPRPPKAPAPESIVETAKSTPPPYIQRIVDSYDTEISRLRNQAKNPDTFAGKAAPAAIERLEQQKLDLLNKLSVSDALVGKKGETAPQIPEPAADVLSNKPNENQQAGKLSTIEPAKNKDTKVNLNSGKDTLSEKTTPKTVETSLQPGDKFTFPNSTDVFEVQPSGQYQNKGFQKIKNLSTGETLDRPFKRSDIARLDFIDKKQESLPTAEDEILYAKPNKLSRDVKNFVQKAQSIKGDPPSDTLELGEVTPETARKIKDATGVDAAGFTHVLDISGVRHALKKHGSAATEEPRGSAPITEDDFTLIPEIVRNPDSVKKGELTKSKGLQAIEYTKRFNGTVYYVETLRQGRKRLVIQTLRKSKTKPATPPNANARDVAPTESKGVHADVADKTDYNAEPNGNEPQYTKAFDENELPRFADNEAPIVRRLENLARSNQPLESVVKNAKVEIKDDVVLINEEATELVRRALADAAGKKTGIFLGAYLPPGGADNLITQINLTRRYKTSDYETKVKLREIEAVLEDALDNNYKDLIVVTNSDLAPGGLEIAFQEEKAHRADYRTREFIQAELSAFRGVDGYAQALGETARTYTNASPAVLHNEVIAKTFRDDATEILGITPEQVDAIQAKYYELQYDKAVKYTTLEKEFSKVASTKATRFLDNAKREFERRSISDGRQEPNEIRTISDRQGNLRSGGNSSRPTTTQEIPGDRLDGFQFGGVSQPTQSPSEPASLDGSDLINDTLRASGLSAEETALALREPNEVLFARPTKEELKPENIKAKTEAALEKLVDYSYDGKRDVPLAEGVMNAVRAGILASINTVQNNFVSNALMQVSEQGAKPFMVLADLLNPKSKIRHVAGIQPMGIIKGFTGKEGILKKELAGEGIIGALVKGVSDVEAAKYDMTQDAPNPNFVRNTGFPLMDLSIEAVKRITAGGDRPFKHFVRESEKRNLAKVQTLNDKRGGLIKTNREFRKRMQDYIDNPTPLMREQIENYADVTTFQNSNAFLDFYEKARKTLTDEKALAKIIPSPAQRRAVSAASSTLYVGAGFFAPFVRTPANVGARTLEYFFPTGVVKAAWEFSRIGKSTERKKWFEDTEIKRKNYIQQLERERKAEDKSFESDTKKTEERKKRQFTEKQAEFQKEIDLINDRMLLPKIKEVQVNGVRAGQNKWIENWNRKFAEEQGKRQTRSDNIKKERTIVDEAREEYWKGEDAGADLNFSAFENRAFAEAAGRAGFGGTVGGLILLGVIYGLVEAVGTTDFKDEKEKSQAKREAGIPNDSVNILGYRTNYSKSPFGYSLKMGINLFEQYEREGNGTQRAQAMAKRFGKDVIATNPLAQSAFSDDFKQEDWGSWAGSKLASPIPRVFGEAGEVLDESPRKYWSEGFLAQFKIKIPGWRESLPESDSYIGSRVERGDITRRALRLIDPLKITKEYVPQDQLPVTPLGTKADQLKIKVDGLRQRAKNGEDVGTIVYQMLQSGEIKEREANRLMETVMRNMSDKAIEFKAVTRPAKVIEVFRKASDEEKKELFPHLLEKADGAKTQEARERYQKIIEEYQAKHPESK